MRLLQIALKDVRVWTRDVAALGILLGMPIVLIFILGSALGGAGQSPKIEVAILNRDAASTHASSTPSGGATTYGDELERAFKGSERLNEVFDVEYGGDEEDLKQRVARGDLVGVAVVPTDFTTKILSAEPVEISIYTDPGAGLSAGIFESVVRSFAGHYSAASVSAQTVMKTAVQYRPSLFRRGPLGGNPEVARLQKAAIHAIEGDPAVVVEDREADVDTQFSALSYYAVSMTSMFLMFGAMFGAFSTIKERREQTLSRLLATPTSGMTVTGGKMLGIFALGMLQFSVLYLATRFMFGVDWGADVLAIFLVAAAEMLAVTGLAVLIASLTRTERGAGGLGPLVIQIQALLGGAFFAITVLPQWLQPVRHASIVGWALEGWQTVQLRGGGVPDVLGPLAALLGFAVVFFLAGSVLTGVRR